MSDVVRDAPAHVDITRASASWTPDLHKTTVRVRNLQRFGTVRVAIGHEGETYHAVVAKGPNGVSKKIVSINYEGVSASWACPEMTVRWLLGRDTVRVTTPIDECIGGGAFNITLGVSLERGSAKDEVGSVPFVSE